VARLIVALLLLLPSLAGAVDMATITGTLRKPNGTACASCSVKFRTPYAQTIDSTTFPAGQITTAIANSSGVLPAGTQLARTLVVEATIGNDQPKLCQIADAATVDISTCVGSVPDPDDINDIPGILDPPSGGTGSGIIISCDADDEKLETGATGVFSCGANPGGGGGGAPTDATYIVRTANGSLSAEFAMGNLATGLVLNTTTTGTPSIYAGTTCTNQFVRALSASGAATCADVTLGTDTTGGYALSPTEGGLASGVVNAYLYLNALDFGVNCADGAASQDNAAVAALFAAATNKRAIFYFPTGAEASGQCVIDYNGAAINFPNDALDRYAVVMGAGPRLTKFDYGGSASLFTVTGGAGIEFRDFSITGTASMVAAIDIDTGNYNEVRNVLIEGASASGIGIDLDGASCGCHNVIENLYVSNLATGIRLSANGNQNTITHVTANSNVATVLSVDSDRNLIQAVDAEGNTTGFSVGANAAGNTFVGNACDSVTTCVTAASGNTGNTFIGQTGSVAAAGTGTSTLIWLGSSWADASSDRDAERFPNGVMLPGTLSAMFLATDSSGLIVALTALPTDSVGATQLDVASVESELEGALELADLQGPITDSQAPDDLTIDAATGNVSLAGAVSKCARFDATGILVAAAADCGSGGTGTDVSVDGGSVLAAANFDDGGDINFTDTAGTVTATVKANSVALTTDTTGNWALGDGEGGQAIFPGVGACTGLFDKLEVDVSGNLSCNSGGAASVLDDLTDVTITAAASGDFLRHNGTAWVDATISAGDLPNADDDGSTKGIVTFANEEFDCTTGSCTFAAGGIDGGSGGEIADASIDANDLAASIAGVGLSGGAGTALALSTPEVTGARTWGDGTDASIAWTWNLTARDPVLTFNDGTVTLTDTATISTDAPAIEGYGVTGTLTFTSTTAPIPLYRINSFYTNRTYTAAQAPGTLYPDSFMDANLIEYTGAAATNTTDNPYAPYSFVSTLSSRVAGAGAFAIRNYFGLFVRPDFDRDGSGGITVENLGAVNAVPPTSSSTVSGVTVDKWALARADFDDPMGSGITLTEAYGLYLSDFDEGATNYTLWSDSPAASMFHAGQATFGSGTGNKSATYNHIIVDADYDIDGSAILGFGLQWQPTLHIGQADSIAGAIGAVTTSGAVIAHDDATAATGIQAVHLLYASHVIENSVTETINPLSTAATDNQTYRFSGAITGSGGILRSFNAIPIVRAIDGATGTMTEVTGFRFTPTLGTDNGASDGTAITATTITGLQINNAIADSGAGTETATTQIGVDIAALDGPGTSVDIGLRNADTTAFKPPTAVTVGAAFTLTATATTQMVNSSGAVTSSTTTAINDGVEDGQIFLIINVDTTPDVITIDDGGNTDLGGADCALNRGGTLLVVWSATDSNWLEIRCEPN
jgi:hypothetical protein